MAMALLLFIGLDREGSIIAALVALIVAALTVSVGAWILLARERRRGGVSASLSSTPTDDLPANPPGRVHD
jgi:hypothetical protein